MREISYSWEEYSALCAVPFPARLGEAQVALMKAGGNPSTQKLDSAYRIANDDMMYRLRMLVP